MITKRLWKAGLALAVASAFAFAVVAPPERCPSVSAPQLLDSAQASVDWFVRNQDTDGTWLYQYDADDDVVAPEYNVVRHAGVTMGLYQAAAAELSGALRSADRGTEWALDQLVEDDDWAAVEYLGEVPAGASALLVAGLAIRKEATGDTRYDGVLRRLGRFLVRQTEPTGAVLAQYDPDAGAPVPGEYSDYYTGEVYWALALLHRAFPGEGWDEPANRIGSLPRDLPRRGRGPLARAARPLGSLRSGGDRRVPRARRRAAHRRRGRLRAPAGGAVRERDPVGQPAGGAVGQGGEGRRHAAGRRVRSDQRGPHRLVAGGATRARHGQPRRRDRRARIVHRGTDGGRAIGRR